MKNKIKNCEIIIPILNNEYYVVVCWGNDKFLDKVADKHGYVKGAIRVAEGDQASVWYDTSKQCSPIIVLSEVPRTPRTIAVLCHEAVHAINAIWEYVREKKDVAEEIYCHSVDAIVREVLLVTMKKERR